MEFIHKNKDKIKSAHDVSDGGLITALLEPAFGEGQKLGLELNIETKYRPDFELFDELRSIVVISLKEDDLKILEEEAKKLGLGFKVVGRVLEEDKILLKVNNKVILEEPLSNLKNLYENGLSKLMV